ncbi:hypothetical protein [Prescottella equi]|uniref:hypothetical protein n=1 Tax=Rhodococcus hoagii TaxID=43767 RepID=UPI00301D6A9D
MGRFSYQTITDDHDFSFFSCGDTSLDRWLEKEALAAQSGGLSSTHVSVEADDEYLQVKGYFTLCPTTIVEVKGSRKDGYPGYLLCKLARCESLKKTGHGSDLLVEAMTRAVAAADAAGGRLLVVDPVVDENEMRTAQVRQFYAEAGFVDIEGTNRMVMTIKDIRKQI